jgi:hypothetical protein
MSLGLKIHYMSVHSILEYDEVSLLTEIGAEVFSNGAYLDPKGNKLLPRPEIKGAKYFPEYEKLARIYPRTNLPPELIEPFDVIIIMHQPEWITENWDRIKHKKVIWRSIGQSNPSVENQLRKMKYEGLKIVRYSPMEEQIPGFIGEDTMIRFYKDPDEFNGWNGDTVRVINISQSLFARRVFCHYDQIMATTVGFPFLVYGNANDNLGPLNGGELTYENLKGVLRDNRVFLYGGTWPACYTLSLIEAMMTGIPVVCLGTKMAEEINEIPQSDRFKFYEIPSIIKNGQNGYYSNDINELRDDLHQLLEDHDLAKRIGEAGRETAIQMFAKKKIKDQWQRFLLSL